MLTSISILLFTVFFVIFVNSQVHGPYVWTFGVTLNFCELSKDGEILIAAKSNSELEIYLNSGVNFTLHQTITVPETIQQF